MEIYCLKCRQFQEAENLEEVTMKNGRSAVRGNCSVCNKSVYKIGKMQPASAS